MMPSWLSLLLDPVNGIIKTIASFIPNPEERAKAQIALQGQIVTAYLAAEADQRAINKQEAQNPSLFVAGWRPAVGWLCVITLAWSWIIAPMITWGLVITNTTPPLPTLNSSEAQTLLYALLGIGGLRTIDKATGNATVKVAMQSIAKILPFKKAA